MERNNSSVADFFKQPLRNICSRKDKATLIFSTSGFLILFLNLFSPFGINNPDGNALFILTLSFYGIQAGIILFVFEFWIKKLVPALNRNTVPLYQFILWYVLIGFVMALANYGYYSFLSTGIRRPPFQFPPKTFLFFLWTTFLIGSIIAFGLRLYFKALYKRKEIVHVKNIIASKTSNGNIQIWSENKNESFTADLDNLLFLEKKDNYVSIYYENKGVVEKKLIRTSLKEIEEKYIKPPLTRCHISYIVNLNKVVNYSGNSKGLKLNIANFNQPVPVSSRYYEKIISELNHISLTAPTAT